MSISPAVSGPPSGTVADPEFGCYYTVKCADLGTDFDGTLQNIAKAVSKGGGYQVTAQQILEGNPQLSQDIYECQLLHVPCGPAGYDDALRQARSFSGGNPVPAGFKGGEVDQFVKPVIISAQDRYEVNDYLRTIEARQGTEISPGDCGCET